MPGKADQTVEVLIGGLPVSESNPFPSAPPASGGDVGTHVRLETLHADEVAVLAELVAMANGSTLAAIVAALGAGGQIDLKSSELRDAIRGAGAKTLSDVVTALGGVAELDIALSALRDALRGGGAKSFTDVVTALGATGQFDLTTTALRDALRGGNNKTLSDIVTALAATLTVAGTVTANLAPTTSGGLSVYRNLDLGVTGQVVKASAGQVYGWTEIINLGNANRYIKVYDKATAPTQADTPLQTLVLGAAEKATITKPNGQVFASGISLRATTGLADNDTGAPTANDVVVNLDYK